MRAVARSPATWAVANCITTLRGHAHSGIAEGRHICRETGLSRVRDHPGSKDSRGLVRALSWVLGLVLLAGCADATGPDRSEVAEDSCLAYVLLMLPEAGFGAGGHVRRGMCAVSRSIVTHRARDRAGQRVLPAGAGAASVELDG